WPGLDRYRIKALVKLYKYSPLTVSQQTLVLQTLAVKLPIYDQGRRKRGRAEGHQDYLIEARVLLEQVNDVGDFLRPVEGG
ncbi:MAG: hypothetical protein HQK60_10170, partial [Deltaproteobacteria bacterium]|nr:hypothetical protein [Deltaproteobacteria bacterium]